MKLKPGDLVTPAPIAGNHVCLYRSQVNEEGRIEVVTVVPCGHTATVVCVEPHPGADAVRLLLMYDGCLGWATSYWVKEVT